MKAIPGFIHMSHSFIDHTHARNLQRFYFGEDSLDGQYLRPSDPAYEQVLDSLAMVARHTPVPLLEALLRWRESMSRSKVQKPQVADNEEMDPAENSVQLENTLKPMTQSFRIEPGFVVLLREPVTDLIVDYVEMAHNFTLEFFAGSEWKTNVTD